MENEDNRDIEADLEEVGGDHGHAESTEKRGESVTKGTGAAENKRSAEKKLAAAIKEYEKSGGKSVREFTRNMPKGSVFKLDGKSYTKQANGSWKSDNGEVRKSDDFVDGLIEGKCSVESVAETKTYMQAIEAAKERNKSGFKKVKMTKAIKAYSTGNGVKTEMLKNGSGVTKVNVLYLFEIYNGEISYTPNTLADNCIEVDGHLVLTPEREELHRQIVERNFEGRQKHANGEEKVITMLGGGPASGKGGFTKPGNPYGIPDRAHQVTIDPDEVKKMLPEYTYELDKKKKAPYTHIESLAIVKRIMNAAIVNGYDYTLDGVGDGDYKTMHEKIEAARKTGSRVENAYMTCPTDLACKRALSRGEDTDRFVPEEVIRYKHSMVSHMFPQIAGEFDHIRLYDSDQGEDEKGNFRLPKLIAECYKGQKITVYDEKAYRAFLAKDEETYDPKEDMFDPKKYPYGM